MRKHVLLIVLFTCTTLLPGITSCTYDYFVDETNYIVFVPEVLENSINDCRVVVYKEDGTFVRERYVVAPWGNDPHEQIGLFRFHLLPGNYKVYCYTNTEDITFDGGKHLNDTYFKLKPHEQEETFFAQPSDVKFHILQPAIIHEGLLLTDTTAIERYTGRITVRFKNMPTNISLINHVELRATNVATMQYLKTDTLTSRINNEDVMFHSGEPLSMEGGVVEVDHRYLPTVDDEETVRLEYKFFDAARAEQIRLTVPLADLSTGVPIRLLHGRRIIIEIDTYTVVKITVVGWDENIQSGDINIG